MSTHQGLIGLLNEASQDIVSQVGRVGPDLEALEGLRSTVLGGGIIDDRKYLIEKVIQVASSLPNGLDLRDKITDEFVKTLWNTLQHPPLSSLGDDFKYRAADGSNNNVMYPRLGAAGSHYARSVTPQHQRLSVLPDPGLIFDTVLARDGPARKHPTGVSANLFYLATIIIHDLFHTDENDGTRLMNSSYLDLGPLYGHNAEQQARVRTLKDGRLKNDTYAEQRLLSQPPGVSALLIAFNRFHNYVVGEMALINEAGRFSLPAAGLNPKSSQYAAAEAKRENDLFQTGRLVTCGLYVNIILGDYLRTILNLNSNPVNSDWKLDPRGQIEVFDAQGVPRGLGNQVSAEFNMIYRWHAAITDQDEAWTEAFMKNILGRDVDPSTLSASQFLAGLQKWKQALDPEPSKWTFGGLERTPDGSFHESDLVKLLQDGAERAAGAFGARNIPRVLRAIEMLGIQQGRECRMATLNEFRIFFKLKPHSTFLEVNSDPRVAEALETLYGHPDNIELYVGIEAEEAKQPVYPGSGLCPGFTISVAILSDAVALVRGDRFYTVDYSPVNLTNFGQLGFRFANGGVMYKLLMRAFPGYYSPNSTLETAGTAGELDFKRPTYQGPFKAVTSWQGVTQLLTDQKRFRVPWGPHTLQLTGHDYMLSGDSPANSEQRVFVNQCLYQPKDGLDEVQQYYERTTLELLQRYSRKAGSSYHVDVVRDIGNLAHARFTADFFNIPLTKTGGPANRDAYTDAEIYDVLAELFGYVFLDVDPAQSCKHRVVGSLKSECLGQVMRRQVEHQQSPIATIARQVLGTDTEPEGLANYGAQLVRRLLDDGKSVDEVVWTIIPTAAAACATQAQDWGQLIELYLSDAYYKHWPDIQRLAHSNGKESFEKLKKYALEGFRLSTPAFGVLRNAAADTTIDDSGKSIPVHKGDTIFADFVTAGRDASKFPDPESIRLDRPDELYIHHGWGPHACLGRAIVTVAGAAMLRVFGGLTNLRRSPGPSGEMKSTLVNNAFKVYLPEDGSEWTQFPYNKKVLFDRLETRVLSLGPS
ncbi:heme peroxidase [Aspergillus taichungensis]|uniref:Heme peroxidase n=1 Tax=Aspergillus taichungensis TaxID=482145 RepID=A0A2J5HGM0_9EURO|nr:heme peroxidase [Aspergillus taichungensis]